MLFSAQAQAELAESQAIVQECLEEKRAAAAGAQGTTEERKQLGNQQAVVVKFEDETQDDQFRLRARLRLKRRDADIRKKKAEAIEAAEAAAADSKRELEAVKATLLRTKEDVEGRDSELEAKGWGHQSDWLEMQLDQNGLSESIDLILKKNQLPYSK